MQELQRMVRMSSVFPLQAGVVLMQAGEEVIEWRFDEKTLLSEGQMW